MYEFKTLAPGVYTLRATAKGFEQFVKAGVTIEPGKPIQRQHAAEIAVQQEKVEVQDSGTQLDGLRCAMPARWFSKAKISTRCPTIPTN